MRTKVVSPPGETTHSGSKSTDEISSMGVIFTRRMYEVATGSNHTVCQMPLVGVYQMPPGLRTCLPRGCGPASVGSQTATTISCGSAGFNTAVMSKPNPSYPPRWLPTSRPLTKTVDSQSTAPKCRITRFLDQPLGTVKVRRYQRRFWSPTGFITPERADSTGNGTR